MLNSMHGARFAELAMFVAVARQGSFRKAAIQKGVAPSAVSHSIRSLEERLGVRLFHRTTRSVSLTDAGQRFLGDLQPAFAQIDQALEGLNFYRAAPFGTVRLNVPASIGTFVLHNVMGPLIKDNPGLHLDVVATDALVDIVEGGFDAGVRFGESLSQDMIAVRIKPRLRFAVVGSPKYFHARKSPRQPKDLHAHACIRYRFPSGAIYDWQFERGGEEISVEVSGPLTLDNQELMVEAALQGCGLAYVWDARVQGYLASGVLVRCLEEWCAYDDTLFLYYPSRRYVSAGLRALIERLRCAPAAEPDGIRAKRGPRRAR
jgi:DNA-binding transcriptional LysR family regulator